MGNRRRMSVSKHTLWLVMPVVSTGVY